MADGDIRVVERLVPGSTTTQLVPLAEGEAPLQGEQVRTLTGDAASAFRQEQIDAQRMAYRGTQTGRTAFEAGVNTLTAGGYTADATPRMAQAMRERREANPGTVRLAEAGTLLGTALLTGGATLAEAGPLGFVNPAQVIGNTAERVLLNRLAGGAAATGGQRAVALASGAMVDGAISGAQDYITRANVEDTPMTAEGMLANIGLGGALGLGFSGPFALMQRGGRALSRAEQRTLSEHTAALGASGMGPAAGPNVSIDEMGNMVMRAANPEEAQGMLADVVANPLLRAANGVANESAIRRVMNNPAAAFDTTGYTRAATAVGDFIESAYNRARDLFRGLERADVRGERLYANVAPELDDAIGVGVSASVQRVREIQGLAQLGRAATDAEAGGEQRQLVGSIADALERATTASPGQRARVLDTALDEIRTNNYLERIRDAEASAKLAEELGAVRGLLDQATPGGVSGGVMAQTIENMNNAVEAMRQTASRHNVRFDRERINPGRIFASASDSGYRVIEDITPELEAFMSDARRMLELGANSGAIDAAAARAAMDDIERAASDLVDLKDWGRLVGDARAIEGENAKMAGVYAAFGLSGVGMASVAGGVVGGLPGALVGGALGATFAGATHVPGLLRAAGVIQNVRRTTENRMARGVQRVRRSLVSGERSARIGKGGRAVPRILLKLRAPETREREYNAVRDQLLGLASNPEQLMDHVGMLTEHLGELPTVQGTLATRLVGGVQYLAANLPPSSRPDAFSHMRQATRPSSAEMSAFMRRFEAVQDPFVILDRAAELRLSPDHVEAVAAVYPEMLTAIQAEIVNMIGDLKTLPSYSARMQIGTLLGAPTDPSLEPEFLYRLQQSYSQTAEQQNQLRPTNMVNISRETTRNTYSETQQISLRL